MQMERLREAGAEELLTGGASDDRRRVLDHGRVSVGTECKQDAEMDRLLRVALRPGTSAAAGDCPAAGELAAFVEGTLRDSEREVLETHLATCDSCQQVLAVIASPPPSQEAEASRRHAWLPAARLRWLVPATAAAAALVVYLAVKPGPAPTAPTVPTAVVADRTIGQRPAEPGAGAKAAQPLPPSSPRTGATARAAETPKAQLDRAKGAVRMTRAAPQPPPSTPTADLLAQSRVATPALAPPGAAGRPEAEPKKAAPAEPPAAAPKVGALAESVLVNAATRVVAAQTVRVPVFVTAPDGATRWRFEPGGVIWRSLDGGASWQLQRSGTSVDLLAGSAPAATTCWAVGRNGAVLLTIDGERWEARPFPERVDLVAVEAPDARTATVTTRDGRPFTTRDGGASWVPGR